MGEYPVRKVLSPIDWDVEVPGSKSMTNRALLLAALSEGTVELSGIQFSDDSRHFLSCLKALGFSIKVLEGERKVSVEGCGGKVPRREAEIDVGSAGTAARFLAAMLGFSDGTYTVQASEQMKRRPMKPLFALIEEAGASVTYLGEEGFLPVRIRGRGFRGAGFTAVAAQGAEADPGSGSACDAGSAAVAAQGAEANPGSGSAGDAGSAAVAAQESAGRPASGWKGSLPGVPDSTQAGPPLYLSLDISESTQFLSALLLVSPMMKQGLTVHITGEKTDGSYIRITRKMLGSFGVDVAFDGRNYTVAPGAACQRDCYAVEPDMSAACYFYAAAAVTGGRTLVRGIHRDNMQGDMKFLEVLERMGCSVADEEAGIVVCGPKDGKLKGISVDMNDFSDQALTLAAIAPFASGKVRIGHIGHIRLQECDRIHAIVTELGKLGISCDEEPDAVTVYPGRPRGGLVETYGDHRVAMAFSLVGLRAEGVRIANPGCCAKTFEGYFELLEELTAGAHS